VSNDNLLNVEEFVLAMHLIQGVLHGKKVPRMLPHNLKPKYPSTVQLPPVSDAEKEAYLSVFQTCDTARKGFVEGIRTQRFIELHLFNDNKKLFFFKQLFDFSYVYLRY